MELLSTAMQVMYQPNQQLKQFIQQKISISQNAQVPSLWVISSKIYYGM
jgi:hypothetical protein